MTPLLALAMFFYGYIGCVTASFTDEWCDVLLWPMVWARAIIKRALDIWGG